MPSAQAMYNFLKNIQKMLNVCQLKREYMYFEKNMTFI